MDIEPTFVPFAATLAGGVVAPSWLPRRRLMTAAVATAAAAHHFARAKSPVLPFTIGDVAALTPAQEKQVSMGVSALGAGVASLGVIGIARLLPVNRVLVAAALGAGVIALEPRRREWAASQAEKVAELQKHHDAASA